MEKWQEIAKVIKLVDEQLVELSPKILSCDIRKSSKLYKDYERLSKMSSKLRSDLEDEMLKQNPGMTEEDFTGFFYGEKF